METEDKIKKIIEHVRPYIQADGGDLEFVSYKDNIVTIKMAGACIGCSLIDTTLNEGVKNWIMNEIPEVKDVVMDQAMISPDEMFYDYF